MQHWGREHFASVVTVDLERERELHSLFDRAEPRAMGQELALLKRQALSPGGSLLFLDEIQACPRALAALRHFHERLPDLHVIAAGSLLDFALGEYAYSMPVGRVEFLYLHPLSFEEFVLATEGEPMATVLRTYDPGSPLGDALSKRLEDALRRYMFIGGMPEAVEAYARHGDLLGIQRLQSAIVQTVQDDFAKYGTRAQQDLLGKALQHVALNLGHKVKFVNISRERRAADVRSALDLLMRSRMVHLVRHTAATGVPLGATASDKVLKGILLDIGLASQLCGLTVLPPEQLLVVNEGGLAEQFVGQELLASGLPFLDDRLFYWHREARNANAEVDYVVSVGPDVVPIEVKAAAGGALRSLFQFLQEKRRRKAIRLYLGTPGVETLRVPGGGSETIELLSLPLYMAGQVRRLAAQFLADRT